MSRLIRICLITIMIIISVSMVNSISKDLIAKKDNKSTTDLEIPKWFLNPPKEDRVIYATGYAMKKNPQMAIISAGDNARSEISRVIQVKVTTMTNDFLEDVGVNNERQSSEFSEVVSKSIASNTLYFSKIEKQKAFKKGDKYIVYALIRLDLDEMTKAVDNSLKNFSNEYNELNAGKGLEDLADEIKGKITKAFKKTSIAKKEKEIKKEIEKLEEKAQQGDVIETGKKPDWIEDYPISSEYYIGIGQGKAMQQAKDGGINTLVTQIEVNVKSEINDFIKETDGVTEEEISQNIKLSFLIMMIIRALR